MIVAINPGDAEIRQFLRKTFSGGSKFIAGLFGQFSAVKNGLCRVLSSLTRLQHPALSLEQLSCQLMPGSLHCAYLCFKGFDPGDNRFQHRRALLILIELRNIAQRKRVLGCAAKRAWSAIFEKPAPVGFITGNRSDKTRFSEQIVTFSLVFAQ